MANVSVTKMSQTIVDETETKSPVKLTIKTLEARVKTLKEQLLSGIKTFASICEDIKAYEGEDKEGLVALTLKMLQNIDEEVSTTYGGEFNSFLTSTYVDFNQWKAARRKALRDMVEKMTVEAQAKAVKTLEKKKETESNKQTVAYWQERVKKLTESLEQAKIEIQNIEAKALIG